MLGALIIDPWWTTLPDQSATLPSVPTTQAIATLPTATPAVTPEPPRPAHLNLDVRHSFRKVELTVSVDGKRELHTNLEGSGKKFGVFGKRAERGFTRTIDLEPGARVVGVRVRSVADSFDQTRTERFDLDAASVAGLSISADKSGLSLMADRPALPPASAPPAHASVPATTTAPAPAPVATVRAESTQAADVFITEAFKTLRQVLLAVAGFIASAATGFVVEEFIRSRKKVIFAEAASLTASGIRRRRRDNDQPHSTDISAGAAG